MTSLLMLRVGFCIDVGSVVRRILGTVPVEADGSAFFELPALRSVFFVALDENELSVKRMQSFTTVQAGETLHIALPPPGNAVARGAIVPVYGKS